MTSHTITLIVLASAVVAVAFSFAGIRNRLCNVAAWAVYGITWLEGLWNGAQVSEFGSDDDWWMRFLAVFLLGCATVFLISFGGARAGQRPKHLGEERFNQPSA
ncbi:hypothetical protein ACQUKI_20825 [Ralstonia pseudosolanacearum]